MNLTFKQSTKEDLQILQQFSYRTFKETFSHLNTPANINAYLENAFCTEKLYCELCNQDCVFYFLYADKILAGYIKLNEAPSQTDIQDKQSLEIERIYVAKEFQGNGLGHVLLEQALQTAKEKQKAYLWLGVWEKNSKAIGFYEKNGFSQIGTHAFIMGNEKQTDLLMRKKWTTQ